MRIDEISIFGEYKQDENRVTAAFLQICKIGGEDLIRYLTNELKIQLPSSEIDIFSQIKEQESTPDGLLQSVFSFKLYVESKINKNKINENQLIKHKKNIQDSNDYLLYLTPDDTKPNELGDTNWANWEQIINVFNNYLQTTQSENKQLLEFLIGHFHILLDKLELLGDSWDLDNNNVIILAGSWAEGVALNYSYYICQNNRSFKSASYLAFYNNNQIRYVFKIKNSPRDNINLREYNEFERYINEAEPGYDKELRKVFDLEFFENIGPIINDKLDKHGNPCPYTYGQPRYTTLETLRNAKRTSQL